MPVLRLGIAMLVVLAIVSGTAVATTDSTTYGPCPGENPNDALRISTDASEGTSLNALGGFGRALERVGCTA
ncbi:MULTISPECIES: hypothetical protein [Halorussus]|uniref:hypothetical protein n=1 Tax=Halorussus TaxID=1070314 RepID=UPI00209E07FD|nr:hypothetical protein [Halorussus vallis]USZ78127.1 hypothetical protein NGM07_20935 [Halorussus vallis]